MPDGAAFGEVGALGAPNRGGGGFGIGGSRADEASGIVPSADGGNGGGGASGSSNSGIATGGGNGREPKGLVDDMTAVTKVPAQTTGGQSQSGSTANPSVTLAVR